MTLYNRSDSNKRKTWLLIAGFLVFVIAVGYFFAYTLDEPVILYVAIILSIFSSFFSYWFSDKLVLAMSGAIEVDHENGRELYHLVENLCIAAGLPLPKICLIEDRAINAFATGRDPEHAVIVVTSGAVERLEKVELEGVVAHELSHIGNRDILLATIVTVLVGMVVILSDLFQRVSLRRSFEGRSSGSNDRDSSGAQAFIIFAVIGLVFSILAPIFAQLMQLAVSRKREFLADTDGALLTRYPEGLARALEKIAIDGERLRGANRSTAHLFFASPLRQDRGFNTRVIPKIFMTHPPIEERIAALRNLNLKD